jgi:hypothetical protein
MLILLPLGVALAVPLSFALLAARFGVDSRPDFDGRQPDRPRHV